MNKCIIVSMCKKVDKTERKEKKANLCRPE